MKSGNRIIFGKHHVFLFINPLEVRKARESSHARKAEVVKQRGRDRSRARSAHTVAESEERDSSPDSDDVKRDRVKKVAADGDSDDDVEDNDDAILSNDDSDIASEPESEDEAARTKIFATGQFDFNSAMNEVLAKQNGDDAPPLTAEAIEKQKEVSLPSLMTILALTNNRWKHESMLLRLKSKKRKTKPVICFYVNVRLVKSELVISASYVWKEFEQRLLSLKVEGADVQFANRLLTSMERRCAIRAIKKWRRYRFQTIRVRNIRKLKWLCSLYLNLQSELISNSILVKEANSLSHALSKG